MVRQDDRGVVRRELVEKLDAMQRARFVDAAVFYSSFFGIGLLAHAASGWIALFLVPVAAVFLVRAVYRCCPRCTQPLWAARSPRPFAPLCCTGCDLILRGERRGETYVEPRIVVAHKYVAPREESDDVEEVAPAPVPSTPSAIDPELARLEAGGSPYREAAPLALPVDCYLAAWGQLAASRRRVWFFAATGGTAAILGWGLLSALVGETAAAAFVAMVGLFVAAGLASQRFSCPRCKKPFFRDGQRRLPSITACVHCGLHIGAQEADEPATDGLAACDHAEK